MEYGENGSNNQSIRLAPGIEGRLPAWIRTLEGVVEFSVDAQEAMANAMSDSILGNRRE
ncbi:hypothetical protein ACFL1M_03565 [Patescibacteria group bacterium]